MLYGAPHATSPRLTSCGKWPVIFVSALECEKKHQFRLDQRNHPQGVPGCEGEKIHRDSLKARELLRVVEASSNRNRITNEKKLKLSAFWSLFLLSCSAQILESTAMMRGGLEGTDPNS